LFPFRKARALRIERSILYQSIVRPYFNDNGYNIRLLLLLMLHTCSSATAALQPENKEQVCDFSYSKQLCRLMPRTALLFNLMSSPIRRIRTTLTTRTRANVFPVDKRRTTAAKGHLRVLRDDQDCFPRDICITMKPTAEVFGTYWRHSVCMYTCLTQQSSAELEYICTNHTLSPYLHVEFRIHPKRFHMHCSDATVV
jgi:hypothetical protein